MFSDGNSEPLLFILCSLPGLWLGLSLGIAVVVVGLLGVGVGILIARRWVIWVFVGKMRPFAASRYLGW